LGPIRPRRARPTAPRPWTRRRASGVDRRHPPRLPIRTGVQGAGGRAGEPPQGRRNGRIARHGRRFPADARGGACRSCVLVRDSGTRPIPAWPPGAGAVPRLGWGSGQGGRRRRPALAAFVSCHSMDLNKWWICSRAPIGPTDRRSRLPHKQGPGRGLPVAVAPRSPAHSSTRLRDFMDLNKWWICSRAPIGPTDGRCRPPHKQGPARAYRRRRAPLTGALVYETA